jgi:hypothetical protein
MLHVVLGIRDAHRARRKQHVYDIQYIKCPAYNALQMCEHLRDRLPWMNSEIHNSACSDRDHV